MDELLQIYDIPNQFCATMNRNCGNASNLPFATSAPGKVLFSFARAVLARQGYKDIVTIDASELGQLVPTIDHSGNLEVVEDLRRTRNVMATTEVLTAEDHQAVVEQSDRNAKAVKADDACVPVELWHEWIKPDWPGLSEEEFTRSADVLCQGMLRWWKRHLRQKMCSYLAKRFGAPSWKNGTYCGGWMDAPRYRKSRKGREPQLTELGKDIMVMQNALHRATLTDWWEWKNGYWHWPVAYRKQARDGVKLWFERAFKVWTKAQIREPDPDRRAQMKEKLSKVVDRRYIEVGLVLSLTRFFAVPKGEDDIRVVYDATLSGLNDVIWTPSFILPMMDTFLRAVDQNPWMTDLNVGEMFLKFPLRRGSHTLFPGIAGWRRAVLAALGLLYDGFDFFTLTMCARNPLGGGGHPG